MTDSLRVDVYLPLYPRDFLTSTIGWSALERGHYMTLLMLQWDRGRAEGLPADLDGLERLSAGVREVWAVLEDKFPVDADGKRRNRRLEEHRSRAVELKKKRSDAARRAALARHGVSAAAVGCDSHSNRTADAQQPHAERNANAQHPPSPSPSPSPSVTSSSLRSEENTAHTHSDDPFRRPGWAAQEWASFVATWNQTARAVPWTPLIAPSGWVDYAATPGWLERARIALERLPRCKHFEKPVAVTQFFQHVDRIIAGEFDNPKVISRRVGQPLGGNL